MEIQIIHALIITTRYAKIARRQATFKINNPGFEAHVNRFKKKRTFVACDLPFVQVSHSCEVGPVLSTTTSEFSENASGSPILAQDV